MDFDIRANRLEKEASERRAAVRRQAEAEAQAQALARQREEGARELMARRREEEERQAEQRLRQEEQEAVLTGGIVLVVPPLTPYLLDEAEDDRIVCPESLLHALSSTENAFKGAATFRITSASGSITHAGVREFSAAEGRCGLPLKVIQSLLRTHISSSETLDMSLVGPVHLKFVRLPKATYAKLQPLHNFSLGPVKDCFEQNLRFHATLSIHDLVTVWNRGSAHVLRVTELKGAGALDDDEVVGVSLVDTDVTIDLDVSEEFAESLAAKAAPSSACEPEPSSAVDKETMRRKRLAALDGRGN